MTPPARLAVFDVDGTLIDSQHNIVAAMTLACEHHAVIVPSPESIRRIIGLSLFEAVARLLPEEAPARQRLVVEEFKRGFGALRLSPDYHEPLFDGALATLDGLARDGWLLAVATGNSRRGLSALIERHSLSGRFISLHTADDNPGKPHPAMMQKAISDAGVNAHEAVMIGDTSYDMQMARDAGARAIGVAWGYHAPAVLLDAGAEKIATNYAELRQSLIMLFDPVS